MTQFQFTCPSRSTTPVIRKRIKTPIVSIHVPLAEHDLIFFSIATASAVSIHVPLAEHDRDVLVKRMNGYVSIHVPLAEHDLIPYPPVQIS